MLDSAIRKLLTKYGLSWSDCLVPQRELETVIASKVVPAPLQEVLHSERAGIDHSAEQIEKALRSFDPTLADSFGLSSQKIGYQLDKIQSKVAREAMRRTDTGQLHAAKLADSLFPTDNLQERVYGVLPFLAKYGPSFVDRALDAIEPGCADHKVLMQ